MSSRRDEPCNCSNQTGQSVHHWGTLWKLDNVVCTSMLCYKHLSLVCIHPHRTIATGHVTSLPLLFQQFASKNFTNHTTSTSSLYQQDPCTMTYAQKRIFKYRHVLATIEPVPRHAAAPCRGTFLPLVHRHQEPGNCRLHIRGSREWWCTKMHDEALTSRQQTPVQRFALSEIVCSMSGLCRQCVCKLEGHTRGGQGHHESVQGCLEVHRA